MPTLPEDHMGHTAREMRVLVGGAEASVFEYGTKGNPTVLAIHGFRGTHFGLEPLARELVALGYRVFVPDLPGCGATDPLPGVHDIEGLGRWVRQLSSILGFPNILCGHSLGSVIVSAAVAQGVQHSGAVLINPIANPPQNGSHKGMIALTKFYYWAAAKTANSVSNFLLGNKIIAAVSGRIMVKTKNRVLRKWIVQEHIRRAASFNSKDAALETYRASIAGNVHAFSEYFHNPTLVIGGALDNISPIEEQENLAAELPDCVFYSLPSTGHLVPYEEPQETAELIHAWHNAL